MAIDTNADTSTFNPAGILPALGVALHLRALIG